MKKTISLLATLIAFNTSASLITVDTNLWTSEQSPARGGTTSWASVGGNQGVQGTNSNGALISDFTLNGDFSFSGFARPGSNDNDILGLVFGWQDHQNHYRLGWERGGYNDISGASGMFLIREIAGVSSILFQQETFWQNSVSYDFLIGRTGNNISFSWGGIDQSFNDTSFMDGHVGFYTESQHATFGGLASIPQAPNSVPEPSTLAVLGLGLLGFVARKYKK